MGKIGVGVIFGGRSGEHEVSLVSAESVIKAIDKDKYEVIPIGINKEGSWMISDKAMRYLKDGVDEVQEKGYFLSDPNDAKLVMIEKDEGRDVSLKRIEKKVDVFFPVLHGTYGEDGTIQGLFEMAGVPYVGADVLGSSLGMDKVVQKKVFRDAGISVVKFIDFYKSEWKDNRDNILNKSEQVVGYPCFIKPANLGSSLGISKAKNREELGKGIDEAIDYDKKVIVERGVENTMEIECSVLGNDKPNASVLGEVIPSGEFYDYNAKYVDDNSELKIPADLPRKVSDKIRSDAVKAYKAISCSGMARVDFLINRETNDIYLNEVNTIPGFTSISMYPKLWEATGLSYRELIDKLIKLAMERFNEKRELKTSYKPKEDWHQK